MLTGPAFGVAAKERQIPGNSVDNIKPSIDSLSTAQVNISHNHMLVHDGSRYFAADYVTGLASSAIYSYALITGANAAHIVWQLSPSAECIFSVYEGAVVTDSSNAYRITLQNRNRNAVGLSGYTCLSTLWGNVSIVSSGTLLEIDDIESSALGVPYQISTLNYDDNEWILLPNTTYLFELAMKASGEHFSIAFDMYNA